MRVDRPLFRGPEFSYGLSAGQSNSQLMTRPDQHQDLELNFLAKGRLTYLLGNREETLEAGRFLVFWGAVPHTVIRLDQVQDLIWLHIPLSWVLQWSLPEEFLDELLHGQVLRDPELRPEQDAEAMQRWFHDITQPDKYLQEVALLEIHARLMRLFHRLHNRTFGRVAAPPMEANRAIVMARFIAENYTRVLRIREIADVAQLTPEYAMTLFKNRFGITMTRFINQHRVWHAQRRLMTSNSTVLDIALESGFGSLSHFNEVFRKLAGMGPRVFRNQLRLH